MQNFYPVNTRILIRDSAAGLAGVCHVPMQPAFCPVLVRLATAACRHLNYSVKEGGVAVTIEGPRFSSRAESLMYRAWGADVVNMTTVPEVVLAKELGISFSSNTSYIKEINDN